MHVTLCQCRANQLRRLPRVFFFNDTADTEIYTLTLHDALPICFGRTHAKLPVKRLRTIHRLASANSVCNCAVFLDRKSTRLNSSHTVISYAVFCLKKKETTLDGHASVEVYSNRGTTLVLARPTV